MLFFQQSREFKYSAISKSCVCVDFTPKVNKVKTGRETKKKPVAYYVEVFRRIDEQKELLKLISDPNTFCKFPIRIVT